MPGERKVGSTTSWNRVFFSFSFPFSFWHTIGNYDSGVFVYSGRKKILPQKQKCHSKELDKINTTLLCHALHDYKEVTLGDCPSVLLCLFSERHLADCNTSPCSKAPFAQARSVGCQGRDGKLQMFLMWVLGKSFPSLLIIVSFFRFSVFILKHSGTRCAIFLILKRTVYLQKIYNVKFYFQPGNANKAPRLLVT